VNKYTLISLLLLAQSVWAEDMSSCTLKKEEDQKNFCKASFAGSGTFCEMIRNGELKRECTFMVIRIQRDNSYKIKSMKKEVTPAD